MYIRYEIAIWKEALDKGVLSLYSEAPDEGIFTQDMEIAIGKLYNRGYLHEIWK